MVVVANKGLGQEKKPSSSRGSSRSSKRSGTSLQNQTTLPVSLSHSSQILPWSLVPFSPFIVRLSLSGPVSNGMLSQVSGKRFLAAAFPIYTQRQTQVTSSQVLAGLCPKSFQ